MVGKLHALHVTLNTARLLNGFDHGLGLGVAHANVSQVAHVLHVSSPGEFSSNRAIENRALRYAGGFVWGFESGDGM
jgi:hypothetical protein